ncbi:MAG: hypothetical protein RBU45_11730 [Myxococcota bacterium]|jgi:hypothetical protein|nr:hypothetical protein [Myxococcota bacterium]
MPHGKRILGGLLLALLGGGGVGCVDGGGSTTEPEDHTCPASYACLTIFVNDRANRVFDEEAGLEWKGAFRLESPDSPVVLLDPDWRGPFPRLYDDGPLPEGHEMIGATAGDHVWSVRVRTSTPAVPTTLEYGVQYGGGHWIWSCNNASYPCAEGYTNGTLQIRPTDTGRTLDAPGLILPEHGKIDLKLTLDVNALAGEQRLFPDKSEVGIKGSHNGWLVRACTDDGTQGDATAGDRVFTCLLSALQTRYDGLLYCGTSVQFVFTLGQLQTEYKVDGVPPREGVQAYLKLPGKDWTATTVERDDGPDQNTQVSTPACY